MPLPPLSRVTLREIEVLSPTLPGFLRVDRRRFVAQYDDGSESEPFVYDNVVRDALDAVVIVAHCMVASPHASAGQPEHCVYLRSALRPPAALRPMDRRPFEEVDTLGSHWELPAGLVEAGEYSAAGLMRCAARELEEELGFTMDEASFQPLGRATFPCAGVIGERHHYVHVQVDPRRQNAPSEDGSVLERRAQIALLPLSEALRLLNSSFSGHQQHAVFEDAKTEIGLRRLALAAETEAFQEGA